MRWVWGLAVVIGIAVGLVVIGKRSARRKRVAEALKRFTVIQGGKAKKTNRMRKDDSVWIGRESH